MDVEPRRVGKLRLFVGQIPQFWTEAHLQNLFSRFGELQEVTVLRHADSLASKGCAFVTFVDDGAARRAMEELHDQYSPSEGRKIQVRDSSAPRTTIETGRLYCANLAEQTNGDQIFELFSQVGKVLSVSVLMTPWNQSKCSCLVEMANRNDALAVIETFNGRYRVPGAPADMTVTWARNTGSKNRATPTTTGFPAPIQPISYEQSQSLFVPLSPGTPLTSTPISPNSPHFFEYPHFSGGGAGSVVEEEKYDEGMPPPMGMLAPAYGHTNPMPHPAGSAPASVVFIAMPYSPHHGPPGSPLLHRGFSSENLMTQQQQQQAFLQQQAPQPPPQGVQPPYQNNNMKSSVGKRRGSSTATTTMISSPLSPRYREGPHGANLFVKNFPNDWETKDLSRVFEPYGEIVSCNVFMDKYTQKSRGFGFVSFANREQAQEAINALNGMQVGDESLIVETKLKEHTATTKIEKPSLLQQEDEPMEDLVEVPKGLSNA